MSSRDRIVCPVCNHGQPVEKFQALQITGECRTLRYHYGGNRSIQVEDVATSSDVAIKMRGALRRALDQLDGDLTAAGIDPQS
jgi:hypothetical protein